MIINECTNILFTFGSEIFCPDLTELPDVVATGARRHVGSRVHMHCASAGLRFIDGKMNKSVTCLESGDWSEIVSNCSGELPPSCAFTHNTSKFSFSFHNRWLLIATSMLGLINFIFLAKHIYDIFYAICKLRVSYIND